MENNPKRIDINRLFTKELNEWSVDDYNLAARVIFSYLEEHPELE